MGININANLKEKAHAFVKILRMYNNLVKTKAQIS